MPQKQKRRPFLGPALVKRIRVTPLRTDPARSAYGPASLRRTNRRPGPLGANAYTSVAPTAPFWSRIRKPDCGYIAVASSNWGVTSRTSQPRSNSFHLQSWIDQNSSMWSITACGSNGAQEYRQNDNRLGFSDFGSQ